MKIDDLKSNLQMKNFYISEASIKREQNVSSGNLDIDVDKNITFVDEHTYSVMLSLNISKEGLQINVIGNAEFTFVGNDNVDENQIINRNAIAIMFPFIRSEVTLLTSQPGMSPIVLPTINTAKFDN